VRRVILNADDLGYDPAVTEGIVECMREGVVSSATLMVNSPHSEHGATLAAGLSLGLHLNFVRWAALSIDMTMSEQTSWAHETVRAEAVAQVERFVALTGRRPTHIDVHKHWHAQRAVLSGVIACARVNRLPVRSVDAGMRAQLRAQGIATNDHFIGEAGEAAHWTASQFEKTIETLPFSGVVELMCHPGFAPRQTSSRYGAQREVELKTFLSARAKEVLVRHAVTFEGWS
jgi:chitin disaccharide deacetylase